MTQLPTVSSVDYDVRDVGTQEDDLVTQFMTSGCGCSQFNGKECYIQFTNEHVSQARGCCLELSHNELDMVLLCQLQAFSISEDQVHRWPHLVGRERKYSHHGKPVCLKFFLLVNAIGKKRMRNLMTHLQENGLVASIHGNVH